MLAVALQPWSGYRVLAVGGESAVKSGDSVARVRLGARRSAVAPRHRQGRRRWQGAAGAQRHACRRGSSDRLGGDRRSIALATQKGGQSTFAMASAIDAAVRAAKTRVGRDGFTAPSATLLPAWPSPAYPADALREASRKDTFDLAPYRAGGQGYRVLVDDAACHRLAGLDDRSHEGLLGFAVPAQQVSVRADGSDPGVVGLPADHQRAASGHRAERRARWCSRNFGTSGSLSSATPSRTRATSARRELVRDGQQIIALDSARFVGVVNPKDYQDKKRPVRDERLLRIPPGRLREDRRVFRRGYRNRWREAGEPGPSAGAARRRAARRRALAAGALGAAALRLQRR